MKTALVTGGVKNIGRAISERLRADGWRVITASHDPASDADIIVDLAEMLGPAKLYAQALKLNAGDPPDALVNNAAILTGEDAKVEALDLTAPMKLTMLMAGRETGVGAVVNILDGGVEKLGSCEVVSAYAKAKTALAEYTLKSAAMFEGTLRVNAVAVGPVSLSEGVHLKAAETPFGRPSAEDVAAAVAFLCSADKTSGVIVPVGVGI